jgi:hypothetical protein
MKKAFPLRSVCMIIVAIASAWLAGMFAVPAFRELSATHIWVLGIPIGLITAFGRALMVLRLSAPVVPATATVESVPTDEGKPHCHPKGAKVEYLTLAGNRCVAKVVSCDGAWYQLRKLGHRDTFYRSTEQVFAHQT